MSSVNADNRVLIANIPIDLPGADGGDDTKIQLLRATTAAGTTLSDVSDGAYRGLVISNTQLVAGPDVVLASSNGTGLARITP